MPQDDAAKSAPPAAPIASGHLVVTQPVDGLPRGAIVPATPDRVAQLGDKARPATPVDLGVCGRMTR